MQLPALGLAASLLLGPAPADPPAPGPGPDAPAGAVVDEPVTAEPEGATAEPEPLEPEPPLAEPGPSTAEHDPPELATPEPPAPTLASSPEPASIAEPSLAPAELGRDRLGCAGSKACRKMTVAGIVVGSLGLAAVGAGVGLLVNPDEVVPERPIYVTSTHPAGLVTVTIGAGVTLTAVLMLVAAHKGYKQRDEQARVRPLVNGLRF